MSNWKLRDFREGDLIKSMQTFEIRRLGAFEGKDCLWVLPVEIDTDGETVILVGEVDSTVQQVFQKGDKVTGPFGSGEVRGIDGQKAWVLLADGSDRVYPTEILTRSAKA